MKLLVACSHPPEPGRRTGAFKRTFDSAWADRFLMHLRNQRELCTGCGDRCVHCRDWRVQDFSTDLAGVIRFPALLPELLDDPQRYLPNFLPAHDLLVAIEIHEEILLELPRLSLRHGGKALIAPVEAPNWLSRWGSGQLRAAGRRLGLEIAVPKPFCSLSPGLGPTIDSFIRHFHLGRPVVEIEPLEGQAAQVIARISAPCGNSHYVAHSLQGHFLDDSWQHEVCRYWHSFPCTASMRQDPELGDTILHRGGQIHMEAFCQAADLETPKAAGILQIVK